MPRKEYNFYVYIMASSSGTLYVGVTNDLARRVTEYKEGKIEGFTKKYSCKKLVYAERHQYIHNALEREKEIRIGIERRKRGLSRASILTGIILVIR